MTSALAMTLQTLKEFDLEKLPHLRHWLHRLQQQQQQQLEQQLEQQKNKMELGDVIVEHVNPACSLPPTGPTTEVIFNVIIIVSNLQIMIIVIQYH